MLEWEYGGTDVVGSEMLLVLVIWNKGRVTRNVTYQVGTVANTRVWSP